MTATRRRKAGTRYLGRVTLALVLCLATTSLSAPSRPAGLVAELRQEIGDFRLVGPMLTISRGYQACSARPDSIGPIPRTSCPRPDLSPRARRRISGIAARASAAVRSSADPEAFHATALLDLLFSVDGKLDRPIEYLDRAARLSDQPGPALADLAAARLIRAERTQDPQDLFEALEAASKATRAAPENPVARFNLGLSLELLNVDIQAAAAWERFRRLGPVPGWSSEADRRAGALASRSAAPAPPALHAPEAEFVRFATAAPQAAREWGWGTLLGGWGAAHLTGKADSAAARLRVAELVGTALERQGGDATLADAVRAVRACPPARLQLLARGHKLWADAHARFGQEHGAPRDDFALLLRLGAPSAALNSWARHYYGATLVVNAQFRSGATVLQQVLSEADSIRAPALRGSAFAVLGTAYLRQGSHDQARQTFQRSFAAFQQAGEPEGRGRALYLIADAEFKLGVNRAAYAMSYRALSVLRPYRHSSWLHTTLSVLGEELADDGFLLAAEHLYNEDVEVTLGHKNAIYPAEARIYRAELRAAVQDQAGAAEDYQVADSLIRAMPPSQRRMWIEGDALAMHAATLLRSDPRRAAALLDSALALPDSGQTAIRRLDARVARAEARLALGDVVGATADLEHVTLALRGQHDQISSELLRASLLDNARSVFDRMVMLHVNGGRPREALRTVERGRASLAPVGSRASSRRTALRAPPGEVVLDYALIGDTLLTWSIRGDSVRLLRPALTRRDELVHDAERARTLLESGASDRVLLPVLAGLYDRLIRPVAAELGPRESRVVLIADGELGAVPFAALYDAGRGRYLVQDYVPRYAARLDEVSAPTRRRAETRVGLTALLTAGPASVPDFPELQPLVENQNEVRAISGFYRGSARVIDGGEATASALVRALAGASLFHFAGHALVDDARPEQSSLLLAPDSGATSGRITAEQLGAADLRHVRLVVLSACETLRARDGRSGGLAGFSGALLAAGVQGVVGSTWRVNDRHARDLMVPFHRFYSQSGDGPAALRQAQLQLLGSRDPLLRSPAAWAGFRYAGN